MGLAMVQRGDYALLNIAIPSFFITVFHRGKSKVKRESQKSMGILRENLAEL